MKSEIDRQNGKENKKIMQILIEGVSESRKYNDYEKRKDI